MNELDVEFISNLIREIGLAPTKAKNLKIMAKQLIDGEIQADWEYLENLAGVGHKTASVLMAQWYGIPHFQLILILIDWQLDGVCLKLKM